MSRQSDKTIWDGLSGRNVIYCITVSLHLHSYVCACNKYCKINKSELHLKNDGLDF